MLKAREQEWLIKPKQKTKNKKLMEELVVKALGSKTLLQVKRVIK